MKIAKELGITEEQRINLARLTIFVFDHVDEDRFDIRSYHSEVLFPYRARYECGASACFCGFGPLAGIEPLEDEVWIDYAGRCFGAVEGSDLISFLFSGLHVNDVVAATKRSAYFLEHGLPEVLDDYSYATMEVPEGFRPNWTQIEQLAING